MRSIIGALAASLFISSAAIAASGVALKIESAPLPEGFLDAPYQEESYIKLLNATNEDKKIIFGRTRSPEAHLLPGEFYTFVKIKNDYQDAKILKGCWRTKTKKEGSFITTSVSIDYRGQSGISTVNFVPNGLLFVQYTNIDENGKRVDGCTFKSVSDMVGPYVLYSGFAPGQGEYTLHFNTTRGKQTKSSFGAIAALALSAAAVWPGFVAVSAPVAALTKTVAGEMDKAFSGTNAITVQYIATLTAIRTPSAAEEKAAQKQSSAIGYYIALR